MSGDHLELQGQVVDVSRDKFKIQIGANTIILGQLSGKMRQNKVKILLGDQVKVKVSEYDLSHGIITARL